MIRVCLTDLFPACQALELVRRNVSSERQPAAGLIMHTDRGSQYGADSYRQLLTQYAIQPSRSRKGNCWDNAVAESFFHTLKTELIYLEDYATHEAAQTAVFEYIEVFYNRSAAIQRMAISRH